MFQQKLQWRYIVRNFRHFRIMPEISVSGFPVALFGYDYNAEPFGGITAFAVGRYACEGRAVE